MTSSLALSRKDAHLAGIILWPWTTVLSIVLAFCTIGHLVPGMGEALWGYANQIPPVSERIYLAAALASIACYLVPCWVAVVVALGDGTRHAGLLAAVLPVKDSHKIASKLCVIAGVALAVWLVWFGLAMAADGYANFMMNLYAAAAVTLGALSGLGATALTRRSVPAIVIATVLPLVGVPVAWGITSLVRVIAIYLSGPGIGYGWTFAQAWAPVFAWGWLVSGACLVAWLALRSVPLLSGRSARPRVIWDCCFACGAAGAACAVWAIAVGVWHPDLVWQRAQASRVYQLEAQVRTMSDAELLSNIVDTRNQGRDNESELGFLGILRPDESSAIAMVNWLSGPESRRGMYVSLRRELWRRLQDPNSRVRGQIDEWLKSPKFTPMRRLHLADLMPEPEGEAIAADVLINATSEAAHMAALAFIASGQPLHWDDQTPGTSAEADWCDCLRMAREDLGESLHGRSAVGNRRAIPPLHLTPEQRATVERALGALDRPHPITAQLLSQDPDWASSPSLECIRTGRLFRDESAPATAPISTGDAQ